jgi:hypothetical protein
VRNLRPSAVCIPDYHDDDPFDWHRHKHYRNNGYRNYRHINIDYSNQHYCRTGLLLRTTNVLWRSRRLYLYVVRKRRNVRDS